MDDLDDLFIWTEALGCGEILSPAIESYLTHLSYKMHVIVYEEDLIHVPKSKYIIPIVVSANAAFETESLIGVKYEVIKNAYKRGHEGTAYLWASLISNRSEKYLIHLDADTIFLGDVISPILKKLKSGYGVVGTRRPYRFRSGESKFVDKIRFRYRRDAVNTHCFGFNRAIAQIPFEVVVRYISGDSGNRLINRLFPVIDFFDRLTFYLEKKSGIFYLDSEKQNVHGYHDRKGYIESMMISFAAVGSGCHFFKNPDTNTSESYKSFALSSYALYSKHLLGRDLGIPCLDSEFLEHKLQNLDKTKWTLSLN